MRLLKRILTAAMACCMLASCSSSEDSAGSSDKSAGSGADSTSQSQSTDTDSFTVLPILKIQTVSDASDVMNFVTKPVAKHVAKTASMWDASYKNVPEPYYETCKISLTNAGSETLLDGAEAQVKVRGNWTTTYSKKPLRIKFTEKQNLLGLNDGKKFKNWVLLAEFKDISMLRNKTALEIARELMKDDGLYSADSQFVEVMINGEYWGVYLLTEQQQVNDGRVGITEPEEGYEGTDIGYLVEYDSNYKNEDKLNQFLVNYNDNALLTPYDGNEGSGRTAYPLKDPKYPQKEIVGFSIKSDIYSEAQHDFISSFVSNAYKVMYEAAYNKKAFVFNDSFTELTETDKVSPEEAVRAAVDVDSLADAFILAELTCDADIYINSFFMSADFGQNAKRKLTFEAPWDFDSALGNKDRCADGTGYYACNIVPDVNGQYSNYAVNPWLVVLMYEDWFRDIIKEKWTALYDSGCFDRAKEMISSDSDNFKLAFERNYDRWRNIGNNPASGEWCARAAACKSQKEAADYLSEWLSSRVAFMDSCWHK